MADRQSQGPVFYSILKDVRYLAMLMGPIAANRVSHLVEKYGNDHNELTETQNKRMGSMLGDAFAGIPIVGLNRYLMGLLKQEAVDTFSTIVQKEFEQKGKPKALDKITFEDMGKSENFLVQTAYRKLKRQERLSTITDLPFILGFALPAIHDLLPKEWRMSIKHRLFGYEEVKQGDPMVTRGEQSDALAQNASAAEKEHLSDKVPQMNEALWEERQSQLNAVKEARKQNKTIPPITKHGYIQEQYLEFRKNGMDDRPARKKAEEAEGYRVPAGWGIQVGLAAKVGFYADYLLNSGTTSYSAIQALRGEVAKDPPHFNENQLTQVYNLFVNEFETQFPGSTVRKDKEGKVEEPSKKNIFKRAWDRITGLFYKHEEPPFIIKPEIIRTRSDPKTLGIFRFMAEAMERTINESTYADDGRDLKFTVETFMDVVGRGYIDVNNAEYTRAIVKYVAHRGQDGVREIEKMVAETRAQNPKAKLTSDDLAPKVKQMYSQMVERQLNDYFGLTKTVTLKVQTEFGIEERELDALKTAKLIGAKRLGYFLGYDIANVEKQRASIPKNIDMQTNSIVLTQGKFQELQAKVLERASKEYNRDTFGFIETREEFERVTNFAPSKDANKKDSLNPELTAAAQGQGPAWANAVTVLADRIDALERRTGAEPGKTPKSQVQNAQGQPLVTHSQMEQMQKEIDFLRVTLQEVLSAVKSNNQQIPQSVLEDVARAEKGHITPESTPAKPH